MRRPGPRPYECVRRAWHSDRHQPIRGSLIKEIFRVANEIHSSSTKQNKEWQEKLPTVVLKAEEIMYSKANSEAEYMDLKTLWDRTNDAINTIIRRDEGSESGQFLQPCIEAALNLGCTPRRASRSQRNCHPRCYLVSSATELDHAATNCPSLVPHQSCLGSGIRTPLAPKNVAAAALPKGVPPTNSHRAYPLFYGNIPPKPVSNVLDPARGNAAPNPTCYEGSAVKNAAPEHSKTGCDLSLRLGPLSAAVPARGGTGTLSERGFPLFLGSNACNPMGSFESADAEATTRKRKASFDQPAAMEDQQFCLQPKLPFRRLTGL